MSFNAKLFIGLLVVMAFSCEQKTTLQGLAKNGIPCSERKEVTENYIAWDSVPVIVKIVPTCSESFAITYKQDGKAKKEQESGLYKVVIVLPNDTAVYPMKEVVNETEQKFSDYSQEVTIGDEGFNEADTSVIVYHELLLGEKNTTMKLKFKFNGGFDVTGFAGEDFEEVDSNDQIYDIIEN